MNSMVKVNIHDAKRNLSRLLEQVALGEEVVIARAGKPVARLVPYESKREERVAGRGRGQVWIADHFDELPADVLKQFYGE